jgi:hypothetical protein
MIEKLRVTSGELLVAGEDSAHKTIAQQESEEKAES